MRSGEEQPEKRKIRPTLVLSIMTAAAMGISIGYNVGFGQTSQIASASSRVVNVHADRLKPLLDALSREAPPANSHTTHMRVAPPPAQSIERLVITDDDAATVDIAQLQRDLILHGVFAGPITNRFDLATQSAVQAYQRDKGLPETGRISQTLLDRLAFERKINSAVGYTASTSSAAGVQNIRRIQRELDRLGFNPGPADGSLGLKTTAAIKQYQRSRGLDPTGLVSEDLIQAMGIDTQSTVQ